MFEDLGLHECFDRNINVPLCSRPSHIKEGKISMRKCGYEEKSRDSLEFLEFSATTEETSYPFQLHVFEENFVQSTFSFYLILLNIRCCPVPPTVKIF